MAKIAKALIQNNSLKKGRPHRHHRSKKGERAKGFHYEKAVERKLRLAKLKEEEDIRELKLQAFYQDKGY